MLNNVDYDPIARIGLDSDAEQALRDIAPTFEALGHSLEELAHVISTLMQPVIGDLSRIADAMFLEQDWRDTGFEQDGWLFGGWLDNLENWAYWQRNDMGGEN